MTDTLQPQIRSPYEQILTTHNRPPSILDESLGTHDIPSPFGGVLEQITGNAKYADEEYSDEELLAIRNTLVQDTETFLKVTKLQPPLETTDPTRIEIEAEFERLSDNAGFLSINQHDSRGRRVFSFENYQTVKTALEIGRLHVMTDQEIVAFANKIRMELGIELETINSIAEKRLSATPQDVFALRTSSTELDRVKRLIEDTPRLRSALGEDMCDEVYLALTREKLARDTVTEHYAAIAESRVQQKWQEFADSRMGALLPGNFTTEWPAQELTSERRNPRSKFRKYLGAAALVISTVLMNGKPVLGANRDHSDPTNQQEEPGSYQFMPRV